jgi:hypothetical protein
MLSPHLQGDPDPIKVFVILAGKWSDGTTAVLMQLRQVAEALKMRMVPISPGITLSEDVIRRGAAIDPERDFAVYVEAIEQAFKALAVQMELVTRA